MSRWIPRITNPGAGGGAAAGPDRFAPTILVGNTAEGDSAVAYNTDNFVYIPDVGDGLGIEAAIAYVTGTLAGYGSILIRPGLFDFNQPTSPAAPFYLPTGCVLRGSGSENTFLVGLSGSTAPLFYIEQGTQIGHLSIGQQCGGGGAGSGLGVITIQEDGGTAEPVLLHDLRLEITFEATSNCVAAISIETAVSSPPIRIQNITSTSQGARGGVTPSLWTRFLHVAPVANSPVWVESCRANDYDVTLWVNTVEDLTVTGLIGQFETRFLYQNDFGRVVLFACRGFALAQGALALDLQSEKTTNVQVTNSEFTSGINSMTNEALRVRSIANGGHATITGCTFRWDRAGAAIVLGTGATGCDRNTITACRVVNPNVAGVGVEIVNVASVDNMVLGNSLEAVTQVTDGGTTSQIANNV